MGRLKPSHPKPWSMIFAHCMRNGIHDPYEGHLRVVVDQLAAVTVRLQEYESRRSEGGHA